MTYPPAPGQPGQPDPYGGQQPGQWGQQPQQPGLPGSAPMPHQFGGPQQGHPGGPQYGQPGFGTPPPKKKTGLIVGICIAAAVVIGGAVTLILLLTGDDEDSDTVAAPPTTTQSAPQSPNELPPNPGMPGADGPGQLPSNAPNPGDSLEDKAAVEALADTFVEALNNRDVVTAKALICLDQGPVDFGDIPDDAQFSRIGEATVTGDTATVPLRATIPGENDDTDFPAKKQGNSWCLGD
ncbi:hypothetical protein [Saccharomonospora viridis]|nr:hypothetical protein [Saccharomonospora viridis]